MKIKNFLAKAKDKNLAWFLGFSAGDGYTTYGRFGIDTTTPEIIKTLIENLSKLTNKPIKLETYGQLSDFNLPNLESVNYHKRKEIHSDHVKIKVDSVDFAKEIDRINEYLMENIGKFPTDIICGFLQGFFDAEGTVSPAGTVEIDLAVANKELAYFISKLLSVVEIDNKVQEYESKNRITVSGRTKEVNNLKKFRSLVGFRIRKKRQELSDIIDIYSLPLDKRSKGEIIRTLQKVLENEKRIEMKKCMKLLNVKWKRLKDCANILEDDGKISQFQFRKRVHFELIE